MSSPEDQVKRLARLPSNTVCPNCGVSKKFGFSTVCIKFFTFVCNECKSSHQAISHRCKSLTMSSWTEAEVQELAAKGNDHCLKTWLQNAPPCGSGGRPQPGSDISVYKRFVVEAYELKRYYGDPTAASHQLAVQQQLQAFAAAPVAPVRKPKTPVKAPAQAQIADLLDFSSSTTVSSDNNTFAASFGSSTAMQAPAPAQDLFSTTTSMMTQAPAPALDLFSTTTSMATQAPAPSADLFSASSATQASTTNTNLFSVSSSMATQTPAPAVPNYDVSLFNSSGSNTTSSSTPFISSSFAADFNGMQAPKNPIMGGSSSSSMAISGMGTMMQARAIGNMPHMMTTQAGRTGFHPVMNGGMMNYNNGMANQAYMMQQMNTTSNGYGMNHGSMQQSYNSSYGYGMQPSKPNNDDTQFIFVQHQMDQMKK